MSASRNATRTRPHRILMVAANPAVSTTLGWPVGFWASELTHPYYEFTEAGYAVEFASPAGGKVEVDALSDPRHVSGYSADDLISMGFLDTPSLAARLHQTRRLADCDPADFSALLVCGVSRRCSPSGATRTCRGRLRRSTKRRSRRRRGATAWPR